VLPGHMRRLGRVSAREGEPCGGLAFFDPGNPIREEENVCGSVSVHVPGHLRLIAHVAAWTPRGMTHLLNVLCYGVLVYATVTRGGLAVARGLAYVTGKAT
jgi:hypothetical protein